MVVESADNRPLPARLMTSEALADPRGTQAISMDDHPRQAEASG